MPGKREYTLELRHALNGGAQIIQSLSGQPMSWTDGACLYRGRECRDIYIARKTAES